MKHNWTRKISLDETRFCTLFRKKKIVLHARLSRKSRELSQINISIVTQFLMFNF